MTKYQKYFQDMIETHPDVFDAFKKVHDEYEKDSSEGQRELNEKGEEILGIIRRYENMLCSKSEGLIYGKFSTKLSEKFWEVIRINFPKIDSIGL